MHYGKPNYQYSICRRQFVESGQNWFVSLVDKALSNKLLLERISLSGICRVCDVNETWLLHYSKEVYRALLEDLHAALHLPNIENYLAARVEEEISRIEGIKKLDCTTAIHSGNR